MREKPEGLPVTSGIVIVHPDLVEEIRISGPILGLRATVREYVRRVQYVKLVPKRFQVALCFFRFCRTPGAERIGAVVVRDNPEIVVVIDIVDGLGADKVGSIRIALLDGRFESDK